MYATENGAWAAFLYRHSEAVKIAVTFRFLTTYELQLTVTVDLVWKWFKRITEKKVFLRTGSKKQEESSSSADVKGCRSLRNLKNYIYVVLALFALTGGAFKNLRDMFALSPDHTL